MEDFKKRSIIYMFGVCERPQMDRAKSKIAREGEVARRAKLERTHLKEYGVGPE